MKNKPESVNTKHSPLPKLEFVRTGYSPKIAVADFGGAKNITLQLHFKGGIDPYYRDSFYLSFVRSVNLMPEMVEALKEARDKLFEVETEAILSGTMILLPEAKQKALRKPIIRKLDSILKKATV